uniref:Unspecific monooxygenase n=1 Tax=Panthera leo TaxID=9689 RepID=A0A8C8Y4A7_PANLE
LREKYGDVFTVYLGPRPVVMLCGIEAIREALVDQAEAFSGRGRVSTVEQIFQGYGVVFANGERWKLLRRFSLATMKNFGMGKRSIEERIQEESQCVVEELRKTQGAFQDPTFLFHSMTANIICTIVFGTRFSYKDPKFLRLLDLFYQNFTLLSSFSSQVFELFYNFLKYFPGTHRQIYKNVQEIIAFIEDAVEKHRETLDPSTPRDFMDAYLIRMDKEKSDPNSEFHHRNLICTVLSLFFAGTETTSSTLRYGFQLMLKYPHVTGGWAGTTDRGRGRGLLIPLGAAKVQLGSFLNEGGSVHLLYIPGALQVLNEPLRQPRRWMDEQSVGVFSHHVKADSSLCPPIHPSVYPFICYLFLLPVYSDSFTYD